MKLLKILRYGHTQNRSNTRLMAGFFMFDTQHFTNHTRKVTHTFESEEKSLYFCKRFLTCRKNKVRRKFTPVNINSVRVFPARKKGRLFFLEIILNDT
jgi:hypothetical protein